MSTRKPYEQTTVGVGRTQEEIKLRLRRYGVQDFGISEMTNQSLIIFQREDRRVRITVPKPPPVEVSEWTSKSRQAALEREWDQEERRLWRVARHWIYAQLEAVDSGLKTFEDVFLADTVFRGKDGQGYTLSELTRRGELAALPPAGEA